jgi:hypothetical protein
VIFKILASPLLIYRVFFKRWADKQEQRFQLEVSKKESIGKTAFFHPEQPNKRAALRNALIFMGYKIGAGWKTNAINFAWHDETEKELSGANIKAFNLECTNISKSYLDKIHVEVFGYGLNLNPETFTGRILEKSELNGKHDAQIVKAPCKAKDSYVYQKIIDTRKGLFYEDIRPVVIGKQIPLVYLNYRLAGKRFSAKKIKAQLANTNDSLSKIEQDQILKLCQKMGVDIAELDVLRNKSDRKIYVVDVNPTAYGPAHGLSFKQKIKAAEIYAKGLKNLFENR